MTTDHVPAIPDYLSSEDVAPWLDDEVIEYLCRRTPLVGLDGQPCWESDRLVELLARGE